MVTKPVVHYTYDPQGVFQAAMRNAASKVSDLTIPFSLITKEWYQGNKAIFSLKGPGKYPPLGGFNFDDLVKGKPYTHRQRSEAQKRRRYGFDYPLLLATGRLMSSITSPGPDSIASNIAGKQLDLGTRVEYAIYHQSSKGPRRKIPFRPFLFIGSEQLAPTQIANNRQLAWVNILQNYVQQVWKGDL